MKSYILILLCFLLGVSYAISGILRTTTGLVTTKQKKSPVIVGKQVTQLGALITGMVSGAFAGATVDIILFPIDTIKTRLQSKAGITFSISVLANMYNGILPAIAASAPSAATFFGAYDSLQRYLVPRFKAEHQPFAHMLSACGGNLAQSVIRVPFEVVKQRLQAGVDTSAMSAVSNIIKAQGFRGLYKGWGALAARDLPFDAIQFPIYEFMKVSLKKHFKRELYPWETSVCGSIAGGFTAAVTTPLDVIKTRIMTSPESYNSMADCLLKILANEGPKALFSGVAPRVMMISLGGAIFFGALESARTVIRQQGWFHDA
eukprot:gene8171-16792_t